MTKKETAQVLAILKAAYPASYRGMTPEEATGTASVWAMQFADMPVDVVLVALQKLVATSKFPPAISEVKETLRSMHYEARQNIAIRKMAGVSPLPAMQRIVEVTERYCYQIPEPTIHSILELGNTPAYGRLEEHNG